MIGNAKRFTAVVLCLLLCLGMTPVSALAAEDAEALVLTEEELSERPELREEEPTVDLNEEETVPEEPAVGQAEEAVPEEPAAGQAEEAAPEEPAAGQAEEAAPEGRLPEDTILVIESDPVIYVPGGDDNTRALDGFAGRGGAAEGQKPGRRLYRHHGCGIYVYPRRSPEGSRRRADLHCVCNGQKSAGAVKDRVDCPGAGHGNRGKQPHFGCRDTGGDVIPAL